MDTSDPEIAFDEDGVCNHCHSYEKRAARELFDPAESQRRLEAIVAQIQVAGRGHEYDCILGVSGGADSSFLACKARELGLRPLAVHFDNGWNAELAVDNIKKILTALDIDLYTYVVDWDEFCDLQKSFLKAAVPNAEIPTDHGINAVMWGMAAKHGIKYILSGSNLKTEGVMPLAWTYTSLDLVHLKSIHRRFGQAPLRTFPRLGLLHFVYYVFVRRIHSVNLLNLIGYDKAQAIQMLKERFDWRPYREKHYESVWTRYYQGYFLPTKFGFDKRRPHLSSMILSGLISRDQALASLESDTYPDALLRSDHEFVLKKFKINEGDFQALLQSPNRSHMAYPNLNFIYQPSGGLWKIFRWIARAV